jgi:hypothetical protein
MATLPCDFLVQADQAGSHARNGPFPGPVGRSHMQVDAAREIEASFDRRGDVGDQFNADHYAQLQPRTLLRNQLPNLLHKLPSTDVLSLLFPASPNIHLPSLSLFIPDDK